MPHFLTNMEIEMFVANDSVSYFRLRDFAVDNPRAPWQWWIGQVIVAITRYRKETKSVVSYDREFSFDEAAKAFKKEFDELAAEILDKD